MILRCSCWFAYAERRDRQTDGTRGQRVKWKQLR